MRMYAKAPVTICISQYSEMPNKRFSSGSCNRHLRLLVKHSVEHPLSTTSYARFEPSPKVDPVVKTIMQ